MDRAVAELAVEAAFLATAAKRLYYHGTSTIFARRILSEGFVPNPKKKMWDPEQKRLASYTGTYYTQNIGTASIAAQNAAIKFGGRQCLFEVQLETRTALMDEDSLPGFIPFLEKAGGGYRITNSLYEKATGRWSSDSGRKENEEFLASRGAQELIEKAAILWLDHFEATKLERAMDKKFRRHLLEPVEHLLFALLRGAADGLRVDIQEDNAEIRSGITELMRRIGSISKFKDSFTGNNARIVEPVTFKGANRILAAVVEPREQDPIYQKYHPSGEEYDLKAPYPIYVVYGKPSSGFISGMKQAWSGNLKLIKSPLTRIPKVFDPYFEKEKKLAAQVASS